MSSELNMMSVIVFTGLIIIILGGISIMVGYIMFKKSEINVSDQIQQNYERVNKEFTKGDQNVLDSTNVKLNNVNSSVSSLAKSVQNVRSNGTDTVINGDLCINNLCMSSSTNKTTRINLDDISGFSASRLGADSLDLSSIENEIRSIQSDLESKINNLESGVQFSLGMLFDANLRNTTSEVN